MSRQEGGGRLWDRPAALDLRRMLKPPFSFESFQWTCTCFRMNVRFIIGNMTYSRTRLPFDSSISSHSHEFSQGSFAVKLRYHWSDECIFEAISALRGVRTTAIFMLLHYIDTQAQRALSERTMVSIDHAILQADMKVSKGRRAGKIRD